MEASHLSLVAILLLSGAATAYSLGCETHVSVIDDVQNLNAGAWGACEIEPVTQDEPEAHTLYGNIGDGTIRCQSMVVLGKHPTCSGWLVPNYTVQPQAQTDPHECVAFASCVHPCTSKEDCPPPATGTATPSCSQDGACELHCEDASTCPTGFSCVDVPNSPSPSRICMSVLKSPGIWMSASDGGGGGEPACPVISPN